MWLNESHLASAENVLFALFRENSCLVFFTKATLHEVARKIQKIDYPEHQLLSDQAGGIFNRESNFLEHPAVLVCWLEAL